MIPKEIIKKIRRVHIKSSRTVNTIMAGRFKSVFRGTGMEFEEVREYSPGDEIKAIDWKVSARLGRPFIKLYREERESVVMLLIDMSASQSFGTRNGLKLEKAAEVASVLAFSAIKNNDKVGVIFFTDRVEKYIPPKKGAGHIWRVIKEVFTFLPEGTGTDLAAALDYLATVSRKKTIAFIISDFLAKDYVRSMRAVAPRHELIAVMLHDPGDFLLPETGIVSLTCLETGRSITLDASDPKTKLFYTKTARQRYEEASDNLKRSRIDAIDMGCDQSVADTLTSYFRYRERRLRHQ